MSDPATPTKPVQNALNLIANIKSPADQVALKAMLEQSGGLNSQILSAVGTVHFARFVFLCDNCQIALFTDYDGDLDTYVMDFIKVAHDLFNALLMHVADPPPLPVQQYPQEFVKWVRDHDAPCIANYYYSAYPKLKVQDILSLGGRQRLLIENAQRGVGMADLDLADIQGLVLRGYTMPLQRHLLLRVGNAQTARQSLGALAGTDPAIPQLTSAMPWAAKPATTLSVGVTFEGMKALGLSSASLASFPAEFARGPGDPSTAAKVGNTGRSSPEKWLADFAWTGGAPSPLHVVLFVTAMDTTSRDAVTQTLTSLLVEGNAFTLLAALDGVDLPESRVHFGYLDGLAQPHIDGGPPAGMPDDQPLAPAGEFLLGYESQYPGYTYPVPSPPALGTNGTFAAYGVLEQDVDSFEAFLKEAAASTGTSEEWIAAKMCGRWRNGVPLSLSPETDTPDPPLPVEQWNRFDYVPTSDNPDLFDDSAGTRCPIGAHIRRNNPRSGRVAGDGGHLHRLLRRGIPYGAVYDPATPDDGVERGLLGLFLCASLKDQFEFLMAEWVNGDAFGLLGDRDPMVGDNDSGTRRLRIPVPGAKPHLVTGLSRFVTTRGIAYCFLPSLTALRYIAAL